LPNAGDRYAISVNSQCVPTSADAKLQEIEDSLREVSVSYEEWEVLFRKQLVLELAVSAVDSSQSDAGESDVAKHVRPRRRINALGIAAGVVTAARIFQRWTTPTVSSLDGE